jgi:hypothetical protein
VGFPHYLALTGFRNLADDGVFPAMFILFLQGRDRKGEYGICSERFKQFII